MLRAFCITNCNCDCSSRHSALFSAHPENDTRAGYKLFHPSGDNNLRCRLHALWRGCSLPHPFNDLGPWALSMDNFCVILKPHFTLYHNGLWLEIWDGAEHGLGLLSHEMPLCTNPHRSLPSKASPTEDTLIQRLLDWLLGSQKSNRLILSGYDNVQWTAAGGFGTLRRRGLDLCSVC